MNVDLTKLNTSELAAMGDEALLTGDYRVARAAYRQLQILAPDEAQVITRLGLAHSPVKRTSMLLRTLQTIEATPFRRGFISDGLATWMKTLPFYDDPKFLVLAARHSHLLPVPNWHWGLQTVLWAARQAKGVDGDFVELGVFRGHTTLFCAEYLDFAGWPRKWWLYDTFEGVPDDQLDPGWAQSNAAAYKGTFSYDEVRDRFAAFPNIDVIQGRVPEILHKRAPEKIAFMHVDLNNAAAEIAALEVLFERLVPGGVIVFDDYGWAVSRAQYEAENAWFAKRGLVILPIPTGQGLFIKQ